MRELKKLIPMFTSEEVIPAKCRWPIRAKIKQNQMCNQIRTKKTMMKAIYCMIFVEHENIPESSI